MYSLWLEMQAYCYLSQTGRVGAFLLLMYALSYYLVRRFYAFQAWLLIGTAGAVAATVVAALSGVDVAKCLVILILAPAVIVVGSEVRVARTPSP